MYLGWWEGLQVADPIYLDAAASTPIAPEALQATLAALQLAGNPGAAHAPGRTAAAIVGEAREVVAELLQVGPAGVVFVSSATEANNLALRGLQRPGARHEVVTTTAEHPSVLATVDDITRTRGSWRRVPIGLSGEIVLDELVANLSEQTALVSIHAANNETGVIQPLEGVVEAAHAIGALVHADASQLMAWGKSSLLDDCDLVTVSSHKMHGPQGAAALVVRPSARARSLRPSITGGGQERGLRSGTVNVAAVAGFGAAAKLSLSSGRQAAASVRVLRARLLNRLRALVGDVIEHCTDATRRLPGILNLALGTHWPDSVESEALLARLPGLAASTGSACHAGAPAPSPVLLAMGVSEWEAARSIRLSLSRYTTAGDVDVAADELGRSYRELVGLLCGIEMEMRNSV